MLPQPFIVCDFQNCATQLLAYCERAVSHVRTRTIIRVCIQVINIERWSIVIGCYRETIFPKRFLLKCRQLIPVRRRVFGLSKTLNRHPLLRASVCRGSAHHLIHIIYIYNVVVVLCKTWALPSVLHRSSSQSWDDRMNAELGRKFWFLAPLFHY